MTPEEAKALNPGTVIRSVLHERERYKVLALERVSKKAEPEIVAVRVDLEPVRFRPQDLRYWKVEA